jgi:hypothetical protein
MIDWLYGKIDEVTALIQAAATVAAVALVVFAYVKTRTLIAVLVAAITAGIFLWSVHNPSWWQDRVGDETEVHGPAPGEELMAADSIGSVGQDVTQ